MKVEIMRGTGKGKSNKTVMSPSGPIQAGNLIDDVFEGIAQGIRACGDEPVFNRSDKINPVLPTEKHAIMFGYGRRFDAHAKHLIQNFRMSVLQSQKDKGGYTYCFDGGFFKSLHNYKYYRFGLESPLYNGEFLNQNSPSDRWFKIQQEFKIPCNDWIKEGNHILICTQPDPGYSMNRVSTANLIKEWVPKIRAYTNKKIIIKPHPNAERLLDVMKAIIDYCKTQDNIEIVGGRDPLYNFIQGAERMITWNSTVAVDTVAYGVPTFSFDNHGFAYDVTDHDLSFLENPTEFNREQWLADIHYAQWSAEEFATGMVWDKFKKYTADKEQTRG